MISYNEIWTETCNICLWSTKSYYLYNSIRFLEHFYFLFFHFQDNINVYSRWKGKRRNNAFIYLLIRIYSYNLVVVNIILLPFVTWGQIVFLFFFFQTVLTYQGIEYNSYFGYSKTLLFKMWKKYTTLT